MSNVLYGQEAIEYARRNRVPCELYTYEVRDDDGVKCMREIDSLERAEELSALDPTLVFLTWPADERYQAIVSSFPVLRGKPGTNPWHPVVLLRWLCDGATSHGEACAARFLLGAWNSLNDWVAIATALGFPCPDCASKFDLYEALGCWDAKNRAALVAWVSAPYYP